MSSAEGWSPGRLHLTRLSPTASGFRVGAWSPGLRRLRRTECGGGEFTSGSNTGLLNGFLVPVQGFGRRRPATRFAQPSIECVGNGLDLSVAPPRPVGVLRKHCRRRPFVFSFVPSAMRGVGQQNLYPALRPHTCRPRSGHHGHHRGWPAHPSSAGHDIFSDMRPRLDLPPRSRGCATLLARRHLTISRLSRP